MTAADDVQIRFRSTGVGEPTLVLLHGWACDSTYWSEQWEALSSEYRMVAVDLAGHGDSGRGRSEWTLGSMADDVARVIVELDVENVILVGHSMGGPIAVLAAATVPDRVVGVIGLDTLHNVDHELSDEQWDGLLQAFGEDFQGATERFVYSMFGSDADPDLVERVAADMSSAPPEISVAVFRDFRNFDSRAALSALHVPLRVVHAVGFPTSVESNRKYAKDFDAVMMPEVGHFLHMEQPEAFNVLLRETVREIVGAADPR